MLIRLSCRELSWALKRLAHEEYLCRAKGSMGELRDKTSGRPVLVGAGNLALGWALDPRRGTWSKMKLEPLATLSISTLPSSLFLFLLLHPPPMTQDLPSSSRLPRQSSDATNRARSVPNNRPISPATFYGPSSSNLGSSSTSYIPPESSSFRQPELVEEEPIPKDPPSWEPDPLAAWDAASGGWDNLNTLGDTWGDPPIATKVPIDGRDDYEEVHWYDPAVRAIHPRPGTGVLPPLLADMLHDPDHALYSVSTQAHPTLVSPATPYTPTADEVRTAIPHPNAYFCREHNGWVLLLWKASTVLPPLVKEPEIPVPDQGRRKRTNSCVGDGEQPFGQANLTHHWHWYEKAVDATKLNPPYAHGELLLDLYLCCQCSMYCLVSDVIPGVIPLSLVNDFTLDKIGHPAIDKTPKATAVAGWETVLT